LSCSRRVSEPVLDSQAEQGGEREPGRLVSHGGGAGRPGTAISGRGKTWPTRSQTSSLRSFVIGRSQPFPYQSRASSPTRPSPVPGPHHPLLPPSPVLSPEPAATTQARLGLERGASTGNEARAGAEGPFCFCPPAVPGYHHLRIIILSENSTPCGVIWR